jgi:hypothetical protein
MLTFGISAYLKLISLNPQPQRTELRKRLSPSDKAYDFHRSLRLHASRLLSQRESIESVLESANRIANPPERSSVQQGLKTLLDWRALNPAELFELKPHTYTSPNDIFKISFSADFGTVIGGKRYAVHLWNTKKPTLSERLVVATLSMLRSAYPEVDNVAVLSLLDSTLISSIEEPSVAEMGRRVAIRVEELILSIEDELHMPAADRRTPPTPPRPTTGA